MDILEKLADLHSQATIERSHYYVGASCKEAMDEIARLRRQRDDLRDMLIGIGRQATEAAKSYQR